MFPTARLENFDFYSNLRQYVEILGYLVNHMDLCGLFYGFSNSLS
jgi:hypothetical protein